MEPPPETETTMMDEVRRAITESIRENRIVTLEARSGSQLSAALEAEAEDWIRTPSGSADEYWGTDEDGDEWRVHVATTLDPYADEDGS